MKIEVVGAKGCAWRARYVNVNGRQVAYIGVDPNNGTAPQLFGGIAGRDFRVPLPTLRFKHPCNPIRARAYRAVSLFWHKVDGRYGWGSKST